MIDRFKFNATVSSYYDIDTPENYEEFEPQFYLKGVDVFCTGEIGIDYDVLFEAVKGQSKNLTEKEIGQIMKHFEDNSNSPECDFVTIKPDKILQCTGLKDKNGKLIYEGDIVKNNQNLLYSVKFEEFEHQTKFCLKRIENPDYYPHISTWQGIGYKDQKNYEIIGNYYENKELLNENS